MPFKSEAQRAYLHANHPDIAKEWEKHTPATTTLPKRVGKPRADTSGANPELVKVLKSLESR